MKKINSETSNRIFLGLFLLLSATAILFLATKSSPFYAYNDWCDANSYFSVGKAMFNGKIPYKDVFDQKGPLLYFLYGLAYKVSNTTFMGVFLLEVLLAWASLIGFYKILNLYLRSTVSLAVSPVVLACVFSSYSFYMGGAAEEICFPCYVWGLYLILKYIKSRPYGRQDLDQLVIKGGVLAGIVGTVKFTGLGFFFAWIAFIFFKNLKKKSVNLSFEAVFWFVMGMLVPFAPWVVYFGMKHELGSWYWGYIYINVFSYSNFKAEGPSLPERIKELIKILYYLIQQDFIYFIWIIPGLIFSVIQKGIKLWSRLCVILLFGFLFVGIYIGGSTLPYYSLPLASFAVLGGVVVGFLLEIITGKSTKFKALLIAVSLVASGCIVYFCSMNIKDHEIKKEDHYLTKFAKIIEDSDIEDPTLLNINCLDAGLYTVADIVPSVLWFQTQTINSDEPYKAQDGYIRDGVTDFVIAWDYYPDFITDRYELVGEEPWDAEGYSGKYYLFRKR